MEQLFEQGFCDGLIRGAESVTHLKRDTKDTKCANGYLRKVCEF